MNSATTTTNTSYGSIPSSVTPGIPEPAAAAAAASTTTKANISSSIFGSIRSVGATFFGTSADNDKDDDDYDDELSNSSTESDKAKLLVKVQDFTSPYDPHKGYRATQLNLLSFARPHMRTFHASWMCFFAAWLLWFSVSPLLPYIQDSMEGTVTREDIWTSNLWSMTGAVVLRLILGPLCDQYGARVILTGVLGVCAVVCGLTGFAVGHDFQKLVIARTLLGCVGGTLVPAQYWITSHFVREICGTTMAIVAGWGAMGGGVAQIFMGSIVFPIVLHAVGSDGDADVDNSGNVDLAWRVSLLVPAAIALSVAIFFFLYSDDCPLGSYEQVQKAGLLQARSAVDSFRSGALNINAWLLFLQFGAGLGIELTMESGIALHLSERFDLGMTQASAFASLFGIMNIFTRGFGGWISDQMHRYYSLRGRLLIHWLCMVLEGLGIFLFCYTTMLPNTLAAMIAFAAFGQMSMGTCFGIVPYVDAPNTGTVAGVVGAGGNVGAIWLANVMRNANSDLEAFRFMGTFCLVISCLTPLIVISGYKGVCFGSETTGDSSSSVLVVPRQVLVVNNNV